jgi:hypothetical protein
VRTNGCEPNYLDVVEDQIWTLILIWKINEHMEVAKIVMVQVLSLVENETKFSNLTFKKNKLHNLLAMHLKLCVCKTFTQSLISPTMKPL